MKKTLLIASLVLLQACSPYKHPETSDINESLQDDLTKDIIADYMSNPPEKSAPGSIWVSGSKGFFKDNRAKAAGDIITVNVSVAISAETSANTAAKQTNNSKAGLTNFLDFTDGLVGKGITLGSGGLLNTDSDRSFSGSGTTDRKDSLNTTIAATVTQVLPNGDMVIRGKREVSINYEMQELTIAGIVRPEDVSANNTISSNQIAQARVAYGGKGSVNEAQQKKWGARFIDRWMPF
ncbi:MAG TPA: flagellar basal body L-ring protein [Alphaproteobacteria bacterium]|mgnify:CR=1 FL=1|nr:flagellar basal body L-ring protein [Alphaproteobacteria bacterium]